MKSLPAWTKKLPKSVTICGRLLSIKYNMNLGSIVNFHDDSITIGCTETKADVMDSLMHEISEGIHILLGYRYTNNTELTISMNHAQFTNHNLMFTAALLDCGLLK